MTTMADLYQQLSEELDRIDHQGQLRSLVSVTHHDRGEIEIDGRRYLNLAGNDWLTF